MTADPRPLSLAEAYATLQSAQKSGRGAPAYSRWVNRPIGRLFAALAYRLGMTPNGVTAVSAAFTYAAILLVAVLSPSRSASLVVALLLLLGYALDSADGQLARLTRMGRPSGEWLDHVIDMGKLCLLHAAVAVSWIRWGVPGFDEAGALAVVVPALFLTVAVLSFFGWLLSDLLIRIGAARRAGANLGTATPSAPAPTAPDAAPLLRSLLRLPSDYGLFALTFAWFATSAFPVTYTALLAANAVILLAALPTWFHQVRRSEEPRP